MSVKMSDEQAKALGIDHLIPKRSTRAKADRMNKTERRFADWLNGLERGEMISGYYFESIKFRLADRTWYTPDFYVFMPKQPDFVYEVKGFWRDDARVKIKVAAEKYPHLQWVAVRWIKGEWEYERIEGHGRRKF